jgi:hypothetical protein
VNPRSKRETDKQDLTPLPDGCLETGEAGELLATIASHSNLPSPRGNLELAHAFADLAQDACAERRERSAGRELQPLWVLCVCMARSSPDEASFPPLLWSCFCSAPDHELPEEPEPW